MVDYAACVDFTVLATNNFQRCLFDLRVLDFCLAMCKHCQQCTESVGFCVFHCISVLAFDRIAVTWIISYEVFDSAKDTWASVVKHAGLRISLQTVLMDFGIGDDCNCFELMGLKVHSKAVAVPTEDSLLLWVGEACSSLAGVASASFLMGGSSDSTACDFPKHPGTYTKT